MKAKPVKRKQSKEISTEETKAKPGKQKQKP
jgi:hypothetical protein